MSEVLINIGPRKSRLTCAPISWYLEKFLRQERPRRRTVCLTAVSDNEDGKQEEGYRAREKEGEWELNYLVTVPVSVYARNLPIANSRYIFLANLYEFSN